MFRLNAKETGQLNLSQTVTGSPKALRSQIVTLKTGRGQHRKYPAGTSSKRQMNKSVTAAPAPTCLITGDCIGLAK